MKWAIQKLRLAAEAVEESPREPEGYRTLVVALTGLLESLKGGPPLAEEGELRAVLAEVGQVLGRAAESSGIFSSIWADRFAHLSRCLTQAVIQRVQ
jgi:hypothetical protein